MKSVKSTLLILAALAISLSCSKDPAGSGGGTGKQPVSKLSYGLDSLVYTGYAPLSDRPVKVYYYIPDNDNFNIRTMSVLFAMHGADRGGLYQVKNWMATADDKGVIVVAPQFSQELYPSRDYQLGGISFDTARYSPKMTEQWTYNIIESLFDYFKAATGNTSATYFMHGHSAGGQWTHRFLLNMKSHRCAKAVESNAGYYTVPDPKGISDGRRTYSYPYSVKGMFYEDAATQYDDSRYDYMTVEQLKKFFAFDMTVHLGMLDTVTSAEADPYLPVADAASAQGMCRLERGRFFYERSRKVADSLGCPFNWKIVEVAESGHSSAKMINGRGETGAAYILFYQK